MKDESIAYACVPGAGGDDAIVCLRELSGDFAQHLKDTFCETHPTLAVLPVSILPPKAPALIIK
jgi:hypothetical protein